jgi:hypothetical protein
MRIVRGDFGQRNFGRIIHFGVNSPIGYFQTVNGYVPGDQLDLPIDFGDGKSVLAGVIEDIERLFLSQDLPDVLKTERRVFQLNPFEDDQISPAFRYTLPVLRPNQIIMVGDGHKVIPQVLIGLDHFLRGVSPVREIGMDV